MTLEGLFADRQASEGRQEQRDSRRLKIIEANHHLALHAYALEQLMPRNGALHPTIESAEEHLQEMPQAIRFSFVRALDRYREMEHKVWLAQRTLLTNDKITKNPRELTAKTHQDWGKYMFNQLTGEEPKGQISFQKQEAYFILQCADKKDYARAVAGREGDIHSPIATQSAGSYHSHQPMVAELLNSTITLGVPIIMLHAGSDPLDAVMAHERQHFINHRVFERFRLTEGDDHPSAFNARLRAIKDEVLAYIRDGSSGIQLVANLNSKLYQHLFDGLSPEDRGRVKATIGILQNFLDKDAAIIRGKNSGRAILVYQLAGVPLLDFPQWLKALAEYYDQRLNLLADFNNADYLNGKELKVSTEFAPETQARWEKLKPLALEKSKRLEALRSATLELSGDTSIDLTQARAMYQQLQSDLQLTSQDLEQLYLALKTSETFPPHVSGTALYSSKKRDAADIAITHDRDTEMTKGIKHKILTTAAHWPQKDIDAIADYFCQRGKGTEPEALTRLGAKLNKIINHESGDKYATVEFDTTYIFPDTFIANINLSIPADKLQPGGEAAFIVYFHHSKFSFSSKNQAELS